MQFASTLADILSLPETAAGGRAATSAAPSSILPEVSAVGRVAGTFVAPSAFLTGAVAIAGFSAGLLIGYGAMQLWEHLSGTMGSDPSISGWTSWQYDNWISGGWPCSGGVGCLRSWQAAALPQGRTLSVSVSGYGAQMEYCVSATCPSFEPSNLRTRMESVCAGSGGTSTFLGTTDGTNYNVCYITDTELDGRITIDQFPRAFSSQSYTYSYTGPSTPPTPNTSAARTQVTASSLGAQNFYNHALDPDNWAAPSSNYDPATGTGDPGGHIWAMPTCRSLTVSDCESAISDAAMLSGKTLTFAVTTAGTTDSAVAKNLVLSTTPTDATTGRPATIAISKNTANGPDAACTWSVQNPHTSTGTPGAVDVKGDAECNYTTTIAASLTLWKCNNQPSPNLSSLQSGQWGCTQVATISEQRLAKPGIPQTFQAPPPGGSIISPDNKWFIAYGTLDKGMPSTAFSNVVQLFS